MEVLSFDMDSDWLSDFEMVYQPEEDHQYHSIDWDWDRDPAVSNQSEGTCIGFIGYDRPSGLFGDKCLAFWRSGDHLCMMLVL